MKDNRYSKMQKSFYKKGTSNHIEHNKNPDYWDILLKDIESNNKVALDFGCGKGRNISNLKNKFNFRRVDGVDISESNIDYCKENILDSQFFVNNGYDLKDILSNEYDFVISTITLQHIPVYDIRLNLLKEIFRVMKNNSEFRFQMGYGKNTPPNVSYFENKYDAKGTNSMCDVGIINESNLINDLKNIGFKNVEIIIQDSFSDIIHPKWIYIITNK